ncbi:FCR3 [Candida oxycetoniae]|uniref:FCR3 n=1 Tax=Candida oxycetoniae TaxID=497107 RepID=A0AAI9SZY9_9ASCO|nr:FCR3 [Candida oxycetoniae]KAI3406064.2 FCR3 [Candida oxycetoniae]
MYEYQAIEDQSEAIKNLSSKSAEELRREQNRAAQRAFRERKETKLRELEKKLSESEQIRKRLENELDERRRTDVKFSFPNGMGMENTMRKGKPIGTDMWSNTSIAWDGQGQGEHEMSSAMLEHEMSSAMLEHEMSSTMLEHELSSAGLEQEMPSAEWEQGGNDQSGQRVFSVFSSWEYISRQDCDAVEVMNRLKGKEKCHEYGPAYSKESIDEVIASLKH